MLPSEPFPLDRNDASKMIKGTNGYKLLRGYRGHDPVDTGFLEDIIVKLSDLIDKTPEIKELDMNPVLVMDKGSGCRILDVRIGL